METLTNFINLFLHVDKNLVAVINQFGGWSYGILFGVIFMETGLVVTPFLPGDSLLFAAGALAAMGSFKIFALYLLIVAAAILGDSVNYWIGRYIGPKAFEMNSKLMKKKYLLEAQSFYEKHGNKTIVLARFVPIVRTFAPFVAGIGKMHFGNFVAYNCIGGIAWVSIMLWSGYFFGNIPIIKENFHYVVLGIIFVSIIPIIIEVLKAAKERK